MRKEIKKRGLDKLDHKGKIADLAVICATAPEHELADILAKEYVAMSLVLNRQQSPEDFFQWALDRHVVLMHPFSLGVTLKNAQDFIANLTAPKVNVSTLVH